MRYCFNVIILFVSLTNSCKDNNICLIKVVDEDDNDAIANFKCEKEQHDAKPSSRWDQPTDKLQTYVGQ